MTKDTDFIEWLKKDISFDYMSGYEKLLAKRAWQAAQADQAEYIALLENDRLELEYKCMCRLHDIEQLQLDNESLREFISKAFKAHPNLDLDIEFLSTTWESAVLNNQTTQKHTCRYSRAMQSYPRKCIDCNEAETHGI